MAYRFDGVDDRVIFNNNPVLGYVPGPMTLAALIKRGAATASLPVFGIDASSSLRRVSQRFGLGNVVSMAIGATAYQGSAVAASLSLWYLFACTWAGGTATPRFHIHDESGWTHQNATAATPGNLSTLTASDPISVGQVAATGFWNGDVVCAGIKKADRTDAQIEALSRTSFLVWKNFGFDWLVGFDDAGTITNEMGGGGDETSRVGTSVVADPPGWVFSTLPTIVTGGGISLLGGSA